MAVSHLGGRKFFNQGIKHMNQKGFTNIILVLAIVAALGLVGYFAFVKKSWSATQDQPATTTQPPTPVPSAQKSPRDTILNKICGQEASAVSVNKCGNFYSTYPTGIIVDAATNIFDANGTYIDSCGGYTAFISEKAKEESEQKCSTYLEACTQVIKSCSSRVPAQY
ncbi:MAG: hypothetical protein Q8O30_00535 [Candidatus Omnitrophota bacterium]|nr:hypothetical protein [Candidatus Omnitrophota bacterium]